MDLLKFLLVTIAFTSNCFAYVACRNVTYEDAGELCRIQNLIPGEIIQITATFRDKNSRYSPSNTNTHKRITIPSRDIKWIIEHNQTRTLSFPAAANEEVIYFETNGGAYDDELLFEVTTQRADFINTDLDIFDSGAIKIGGEMVEGEPFHPGSNRVCYDLFYGQFNRPTRAIYSRCIPECIDKQVCSFSELLTSSQLPPLNPDAGEDSIIGFIDSKNYIVEPNEADNFRSYTTNIQIVHNIRHIMWNRGWRVAASLQSRWLQSPARKSIGGNDFSGGSEYIERNLVTIDWLLNNAPVGSYINEKYNELLDPKQYQQVEKTRIRDSFIKHIINRYGRRETLPISLPRRQGEALKVQFAKYLVTKLGNPLSDVYAAIGRFQLISIPIGEAKRIKRNSYQITVTHVGIYALDTYDFNDGRQILGAWDNHFMTGPESGTLITNQDYDNYRRLVKKGGDFIVETPLKIVPLQSPFVFEVRV